jgi:hypothetical protein
MDFEALDARVLELLREYIRLDTTNPPGDGRRRRTGWRVC